MKRHAVCLALLILCLTPVSALSASFSWSTPWSSGSLSTGSSSTVDTSGTLAVNNTSVDWSFALDKGAQTVSATAGVNGQDYSASLDWSNLLSWLFY